MSNTILTHQMIAREAAKMLVEQAAFIKNINTGRSGDILESVNGYKKGGFVDIGVPPTPVVFDGSNFAGGGSAPDMTETKVRLQLTTQKHVPITFTAQEKILKLDAFKARFLQPSMQALVSIVENDMISQATLATPNVVGTAGSALTPAVYGLARGKLNQHLAPYGMRSSLISSDVNAALVAANSTLFHASSELEDAFMTGAQGQYANFEFYESQELKTLTNGAANTAYLVNGASQTGTSLIVDTGAGAAVKGQIFTIANVYATHPVTGLSTGVLRQFVLTADYAGGGGTMAIYPGITATSSTVVGTVNAVPADNAAITFFGTLSTAYRQGLAWQKDAFAGAFAPLPVLASCEGYTATLQNVSVRVMTFGNGSTDTESTRLDVLYGFAAVRPDHATRVTE